MIIGIDLGTTNSACGVWRGGDEGAVLVPNPIGDVLTPSAIGIGDDGALLVGMAARERQVTHPHLTATAFKRHMGTRQGATLGQRRFSAEELSSLVLAQLKADAEAWTGEAVTAAVVTVPAYFNDRQRKATRRAGELAGLKVDRLLNEPTAAALAYGLATREEKEPFLVFDLGGGTFDVSVVEMFEGIVEVRASAGDNRLGGEDFNEAIVEAAMPSLALPEGFLHGKPDQRRQLLRVAAERCRRGLTDADEAPFAFGWEGQRYATTVTTAEFEAAAKPLLDRLRDPVLRSLRDSGIRVDALSEVVLVGGATRMPLIRRTATRMFGRFPGTAVHPDHAVALGAAVQAGLRGKGEGLGEIRLTDVCPFTLGVAASVADGRGGFRHGIFSPIIERNTPVPCSRVNSYATTSDNQAMVEVEIYQGEARLVEGNVRLGALQAPVPKGPAGQGIECRFSYDTSGLLEVDVRVPGLGITRNLVIMDEEDAMTTVELAERRAALAGLKHHPREDAANAALMARALRCFEEFTGESREAVGHWIAQYEAVLDRQDARQIATASAELTAALDGLEGERWL